MLVYYCIPGTWYIYMPSYGFSWCKNNNKFNYFVLEIEVIIYFPSSGTRNRYLQFPMFFIHSPHAALKMVDDRSCPVLCVQ